MFMNDLSKTRLFHLLMGSSSVSNEKMQHAYVEFTENMKCSFESETDKTKLFRILTFSRIELALLEKQYFCEQGEKCIKNCVFT